MGEGWGADSRFNTLLDVRGVVLALVARQTHNNLSGLEVEELGFGGGGGFGVWGYGFGARVWG